MIIQIFRAILLALLVSINLYPLQVWAQLPPMPITAGQVPVGVDSDGNIIYEYIPIRAKTLQYMSHIKNEVIPLKQAQMPGRRVEAEQRALEARAGGSPHAWDRGTDPATLLLNHLNDLKTIIFSDLYNCLIPKLFLITGICVKITLIPPSIRIGPVSTYRLPVAKNHSVDYSLKSGYMISQIQELMKNFDEWFYEQVAEIITESQYNFRLAPQLAIDSQLLVGLNYPTANRGFEYKGSDAERLLNEYSGSGDLPGGLSIDKDLLRFRQIDSESSGTVTNEYNYMSEIAGTLFSVLPFMNCHKERTPRLFPPISSDWIDNLLAGRWGMWSAFLFPAEYAKGYMHSNRCSGTNVQDGRTPWDMLYTGHIPHDALNWALTDGDTCKNTNQGRIVPVTNTVDMAYHSSTGAILTTRKGLKYAFKMFPSMFYGKDGIRKKDRVQCSLNDDQPHECLKADKFHEDSDFKDSNLVDRTKHADTTIHWRYFNVCNCFRPTFMVSFADNHESRD